MSKKRKSRNDSLNIYPKVLKKLSTFNLGEWQVGNEVVSTQKTVNLFSKENLQNIRQKKQALDIISKCKFDEKGKLRKNHSLTVLRASIVLGCPVLDSNMAKEMVNDGLNVNFSHSAINRAFYLKRLKLKNRHCLSILGLQSIMDGKNSIFENFKHSKRRKSPVISTVFLQYIFFFLFLFLH